MIGSLYSGISGLKANTDAMSVIGDNIANVNTTGFKSSKASFADVLSGVTGKEIGQGVMMLGQNTDWTQGAPESTGNATDLAITGDGLFVVRDSAEAVHYTRVGSFQFDNAGNLVTHDGMIVQGYKIDPATGTLGVVSNITIESGNCSPLVTSEMSVNLNLNADDTNGLDESVGSTLTVDCINPDSDITFTAVSGGTAGNAISIEYADSGVSNQTLSIDVDDSNSDDIIITVNLATGAGSAITSTASEIAAAINVKAEAALLVSAAAEGDGAGVVEDLASADLANGVDVADNAPDTYSNTITAYDSKGSAVDITAQYTCVGQGRWVWDVNPSDGLSLSTGVISFDENGKLSYPVTNPKITITGLSNGAENLEIDWNLVGNNNFTGYSLLSSTSSQIQNGYSAGTLQSVSVDDEGFVVKTYSNGQLIPGYRIALADFSSYAGLARTGNNLYSESRASGQPTFGTPGSGSLGSINSRSLEMSNVDLATEFVRMITTQRAFQASSRVITTSDEILQELINLKR